MNERATERKQLPHSTGQASRGRVALFDQVGHGEQSLDPFFQFVRRHAIGAAEEAEVFVNCQIGIKTEALRDITKLGADQMSILPDVGGGDESVAATRPAQST